MNVKEVLHKHNLEYKLATKDYIIRCVSPEHDDIHPSCHVDKLTGVFHCWSCGFSGDIYAHFEENTPSFINRKVEFLKKKIIKLLWSKPLEIPLDASMVTHEFRGISGLTLAQFEAFTSEDKDLDMEGRIIFPIRDIEGEIILFVGRYMYSDLSPKYKYFPEHVEIPLYPEIPIIKDGSIILVEGIFDMLNLWDKGLQNIVFCSGVNLGLVKKKVKQARNIDRLLPYKYQGVNTLHILYDGDKAGRQSAKGLKNYTDDIFNVNILELDEGSDPGSLSEQEVLYLRKKLYE